MLSFLLVLHTRCWLSILSLLFFSSKDMKEVAGAEEWLYLISLFVKSKLFLRNQAPDFPLHLSDHNVAMLRKASICHFGLLLWEGEFSNKEKEDGDDYEQENVSDFHGCSKEKLVACLWLV